MIIRDIPRIAGAMLFTPEPYCDERGFFCRTFDADVVRAAGIDPTRFTPGQRLDALRRVWCAVSTYERGSGRQSWCAARTATIFDVIVDLRPSSPTYGNWESFELRGDNRCRSTSRQGVRTDFRHSPSRRTSPTASTAPTIRGGRIDRIRRSRSCHSVATPGWGDVAARPGGAADSPARRTCCEAVRSAEGFSRTRA